MSDTQLRILIESTRREPTSSSRTALYWVSVAIPDDVGGVSSWNVAEELAATIEDALKEHGELPMVDRYSWLEALMRAYDSCD